MAKYLVVAHQTALSPDLQKTVKALIVEDAAAEFALLVPDTPGLTVTWEGETADSASQRADAAKALLEETVQARVFRTAVGRADPLQAITDELRAHAGYDALVICTLPPGISRWLKLDLVHRAQRHFGRRVIHVVAEAPAHARR